ncbi:hypothetical protein APS56_05240 [Pseudalgibacter alginicilyticus]|uniref:Glycosyltransferase n=1 Tax=Pseudalgibacter alginicilyticus TaxID=1736674 RepID=A0A0P0CEL9_9FLAO|nr:glycosyltransferase [Pseudalgibacter alginicilyticus]ALJ04578.1 hypothetical protein APS56_05240 [Pseudalgibacter alginicilyticus]
MKVLQLIDSLNAGGAERMAVNYANSLTSHIEKSYLCATREEGLLKESLVKEVQYLFLNKKAIVDFKAIKTLNVFIKKNNIQVIHAHATSYFLATIIKILNPKLVLIWHDHYGKSEYLNERPTFVLKWCSKLFNHIFSVNKKLKAWAENVLLAKSVTFLPNYAVLITGKAVTQLKGENGARIICLANLRPQKDLMNLLKAFKKIDKKCPAWTLHLVGQDFNDDYSDTIKEYIINQYLEQRVFLYGSCSDTNYILKQSTIGVLSSKSEGLPLALLEYGLAKLPAIATNVGDCYKVISKKSEGLLVEPQNDIVLAEALITYINDLDLRQQVSKNLHEKVSSNFSEVKVVKALIEIYNTY